MFLGTVFKMNDNMLIAQAVLSSYMSEESKDYLDLLLPFVKVSLPNTMEDIISLGNIQSSLENDFGIDLPLNVIEKLLKRLDGEYVREEEQHIYYLTKCYDSKEFKERFGRIKSDIEHTVDSLYDFLKDDKVLSGITKDRVQEMLINFLDIYDFYMAHDSMVLNDLTIFDSVKDNYYIANYFLRDYVYSKHNHPTSATFNCMVEIAKGSLAAKAIYYFINSENTAIKNLNGTEFILDTDLLIDAIGLSKNKQAFHEFSTLITSNGGVLVTFNYFVNDLQKRIERFISHPEERYALGLEELRDSIHDEADYMTALRTFETCIKDKGIKILKNPDSQAKMDENCYLAVIRYIKGIREGNAPHSLFDCKAIFVTKEKYICEIYNEYEKKSELSYLAIMHLDLSAILWLATFSKECDLSKLLILENAYAAFDPNEQMCTAIIHKIKLLKLKKSIDFKGALDVRTKKIFDERQNNSDKENVKQISNKSISRKLKTICEEFHQIDPSQDELVEALNKVIALGGVSANNLKSAAQNLDDVINEVKSDELRTLRDKIYTKAREYADSAKSCAEKILNILKLIILLMIDCTVTMSIAKTTNFENNTLSTIICIVFFTSVLGAISLCNDIIKTMFSPLTRKVSENVWDVTYALYMRIYKWLYKDMDNNPVSEQSTTN